MILKQIFEGYPEFLDSIKQRINTASLEAAQTVNQKLILLYWQIGRDILDHQRRLGWGAKVIDQLSHDLSNVFPSMKGFSRTNLHYMRLFAETYPDEQIVQALGQLTWYHNITVLDKVKDHEARLWYLQQALEHSWSRNMMVMQIELNLYKRQGKAITNFFSRPFA